MSALRKEVKEPRPVGSVVIGVWVALFGALLASVYLFSFPAKSYTSLAQYDEAMEDRASVFTRPGDASYFTGETSRTRDWQSARSQFLGDAASLITIRDRDVNAWLSASFISPQKPSEETGGLLLLPKSLNVSFAEAGKFHLSLPLEYELAGKGGEFVLSIVGDFRDTEPSSFRIQKFQVNSAPLPFAGIIGEKILSALLGAFKSAPEYQAMSDAWGRVQNVTIERGMMTLQLQ